MPFYVCIFVKKIHFKKATTYYSWDYFILFLIAFKYHSYHFVKFCCHVIAYACMKKIFLKNNNFSPMHFFLWFQIILLSFFKTMLSPFYVYIFMQIFIFQIRIKILSTSFIKFELSFDQNLVFKQLGKHVS